ncbi:MAG: hypothetical protein PHF74_03085, partial [Dehalococcoidales bacterium]|nr:hypothetical protein [Dehalococcoidales bacterium]
FRIWRTGNARPYGVNDLLRIGDSNPFSASGEGLGVRCKRPTVVASPRFIGAKQSLRYNLITPPRI